MSVSRSEVIDALAACNAQELRLILDACEIPAAGSAEPRELAERVVRSLWWAWCTPIGYAIDQVSLDMMVDGVARRLRVTLPAGDAWERLDALTRRLVRQAEVVSFHALDPEVQARAHGSVFPTLAWTGGSLGIFGTGVAARLVVQFAGTPIGRVIPWIPQVGPWFVALRKASSLAAVVATPLGVALGILALNQALGTRWRTVLPVLLSIGTLRAHVRSVRIDESR